MVWKFYWLIVVFYEEYGFYRSILYQQLDNVNDVSKEAVMHTTFTFFHHAGGDHHLKWSKDVVIQHTKNVLAIVGAIFLLCLLALSPVIISIWNKVSQFDNAALSTYTKIASTLIDSGNPAVATSWRVPVKEELKIEDIEEVMDFVAAEFNLKRVGESTLFDDRDKK